MMCEMCRVNEATHKENFMRLLVAVCSDPVCIKKFRDSVEYTYSELDKALEQARGEK